MNVKYLEYLEAIRIVQKYENQKLNCPFSTGNLDINQLVGVKGLESTYWIEEIQGEDVLIRTTEDPNDPDYNDYLLNFTELILDVK